jgi:hypothetical protein
MIRGKGLTVSCLGRCSERLDIFLNTVAIAEYAAHSFVNLVSRELNGHNALLAKGTYFVTKQTSVTQLTSLEYHLPRIRQAQCTLSLDKSEKKLWNVRNTTTSTKDIFCRACTVT